MRRVLSLSATVPLLLAAACADSPTTVSMQMPSRTSREVRLPVHWVSGGGKLDVSFLGVPNEQYGFTARVDAFGNASGEVHADFSSPDVTIQGVVECLSVVGTEAWIGVRFTKTDLAGIPVGSRWIFKVKDNGQGKGSPPDQMSYFFGWAGGSCANPGINAAMLDWAAGNITVR